MNSLPVIISAIGLLSVLSTVYMGIDLWRKRVSSSSTDVVSSAVELLRPYKIEVAELRAELTSANATIAILKEKLTIAERQIGLLNEQLISANTELDYLRMQVRLMSTKLKEHGQ